MLRTLQAGYANRAVPELEEYARQLFVQGPELTVLGTSDSEWHFGADQAMKLLASDWKDWGDVLIDCAGTEWSSSETAAWFHTTGTVVQDFGLSEATYDAFVDNVRGYLEEDPCWLGPVPDETRLTSIAWELTHLLTGPGKSYRWPLRLTGVAVPTEAGWRLSQLQFSLPATSAYPDERFWPGSVYRSAYDQAAGRLRANALRRLPEPEITAFMKRFRQKLTNRQITASQVIRDFFVPEACWIGTDGPVQQGSALVNAIAAQRDQWCELELESDGLLITRRGDTAWLLTQGETRVTRTRQEAVSREIARSREVLDLPLPAKEKLLRINRNISTMLNELSKGVHFQWPVRLEAVLVRSSDEWLIHSLQWSYPANIILEGKMAGAEEL